MKKLVAFALIFVLIASVGCAEVLGVQIIGGMENMSQPLNFDDIQLGESYRIDDCAIVQPISFNYYDCFAQYNKDFAGDNSHGLNDGADPALVYWDNGNWYHTTAHWVDSTSDAEFAWLLVDIVNLEKTDTALMENISVKAVYDDEYEYAGFVRQFNYDYITFIYRKAHEGEYPCMKEEGKQNVGHFAIDPENEQLVGPMYTGHYVIGCTLPNYVVEAKEPLRIEIAIDGNDLTYNIRK